MAASLIRPLGSFASASLHSFYSNLNIIEKPNPKPYPSHFTHFATKMSTGVTNSKTKIIDSHLHVWASPQEAAEKYPHFPEQEPTLPGHVDFLLQPSLSDGVLPIQQKMEKGGYRAVRFNPYLSPPIEQMTNDSGKAMFSKAGELEVPLGFMCMKVYVKFSALFRFSREKFPYKDLASMLSKHVSSFGANRVMWRNDFPFVVPECGYNEAKQGASLIAHQTSLSSEELEWIMGGTIIELFKGQWRSLS
ncbi:hypothetical protein AKJ16_DCAP02108 [Drosera capensis]